MKIFITSLLLFVLSQNSPAQIGIGTNTPNPSSVLDLTSTNKGFLLPRMTTAQRDLIAAPVAGMMIFNLDSTCIEIFRDTVWFNVCTGTSSVVIQHIRPFIPGVTICNQTWMEKNLDVTTYSNGDIIPEVEDSAQWAQLTTGAWCWYRNDSATYGSVYGRLYNWYAVNDSRGLAPAGWHIPSDAEWNTLALCLDKTSDTSCIDCAESNTAGGAMKVTGTTWWISPNAGATNSSDFSALPAGLRYDYGSFVNTGEEADWWSSTPASGENVFYHFVSYYNGALGRNSYGKGLSSTLGS